MDLGVPALDLALWVLGYPEVERVSAVTPGDGFDVEEAAHLCAVTRSGVALSLAASWRFHGADDRHRFQILGSEGAARLWPLSVFREEGGRAVDVTPRQPLPRGGEDLYTSGYRRLLDHFVRVAAGGRGSGFGRTPGRAAHPDEPDRGRVRVGAGGPGSHAILMGGAAPARAVDAPRLPRTGAAAPPPAR